MTTQLRPLALLSCAIPILLATVACASRFPNAKDVDSEKIDGCEDVHSYPGNNRYMRATYCATLAEYLLAAYPQDALRYGKLSCGMGNLNGCYYAKKAAADPRSHATDDDKAVIAGETSDARSDQEDRQHQAAVTKQMRIDEYRERHHMTREEREESDGRPTPGSGRSGSSHTSQGTTGHGQSSGDHGSRHPQGTAPVTPPAPRTNPADACPNYTSCLDIATKRGTHCGNPNSVEFRVVNTCSHPVSAVWCPWLLSGKCGDCKAWTLGPGEERTSFTCEGQGTYVKVGTTPTGPEGVYCPTVTYPNHCH